MATKKIAAALRVDPPHHYSRTRGTAIGAVVGALIEHRHPLEGAVIGGALGNAVQHGRYVHERHKHHRHQVRSNSPSPREAGRG